MNIRQIETPVTIHSTGSKIGIIDDAKRFVLRQTVNSYSPERFFQLDADLKEIVTALNALATATAKIEALEAELAAAEKLCDAEVFAVVYSNYDPLEIDSLWATEQLAIDHRDRLNDSMWTVVRMTVHSKPYTADEENTDA